MIDEVISALQGHTFETLLHVRVGKMTTLTAVLDGEEVVAGSIKIADTQLSRPAVTAEMIRHVQADCDFLSSAFDKNDMYTILIHDIVQTSEWTIVRYAKKIRRRS